MRTSEPSVMIVNEQRYLRSRGPMYSAFNGAAKLALAFGLSAIGVKTLKDKSLLPENPFKTS